ncbi:hypothetical protein KC921_02015 [Candidatus Woesebacteria bacterium]|nr:hypothetical protein [Candidatus Woesebacteria bacterium]
MILHLGLFAVLSAIFGFLLEILFSEEKKPLTVGVVSFVATAIVAAVTIWLVMPYFTWWSIGGNAMLFFLALVVAITTSFLANPRNGGWRVGVPVAVVLVVVWAAIVMVFSQPGAICDNNGYQEMVSLLNLQESSESFRDTDRDQLLRVTPEQAMLKARQELSTGENLGAYLQPNRPYLQKVNQRWYYIVDLRVSNWRAFRNRGAVVPGYVVVDAQDPYLDAVLKTGYQIQYAPTARWTKDLDRFVYFSYSINNKFRIDDLDGMEVDENWNPYYTGTKMAHVVGWKGMRPAGMIVIDPQTGQITDYNLNQIPEWVDRIYSADWVKTFAGWWGSYHDHRACEWQGTAGQKQIDGINDVITADGLEFQVTMTSAGSDQSVTDLIYVNPRTGTALRQSTNTATVSSVVSLVSEASKKITAEGYDARQCELQMLLGRQVWYCILNGRSGGDASSSGSYAGVAFVEANKTTDNTSVVIAERLDDAYRQLQRQIATSGGDNTALNATQVQLQFVGVIERKSYVEVNDVTGSSVYLFKVVADDAVVMYVMADATSLNAANAREGDSVTVTAYQEFDQPYYTAVDINIVGEPDFDQ